MTVRSDHDLITEIHGDVKYIRETVKDHEKRIRKGEAGMEQLKGTQRTHTRYLAVFMTIGTMALAVIDWFKK